MAAIVGAKNLDRKHDHHFGCGAWKNILCWPIKHARAVGAEFEEGNLIRIKEGTFEANYK